MDGRYGFTTSFSIKGRQLILLKPSTFYEPKRFCCPLLDAEKIFHWKMY